MSGCRAIWSVLQRSCSVAAGLGALQRTHEKERVSTNLRARPWLADDAVGLEIETAQLEQDEARANANTAHVLFVGVWKHLQRLTVLVAADPLSEEKG
ncbi:hypothetical protein ColTof4_09152 [Colletotrichum tofieldiae]|nr:hypothetical protein ColTof4_09152 [Colletotrichum tofieldiae]